MTSQTNTQGWAKAGVMIRETLDPGAREASMIITPTNGSVFLYRTSTGGSTDGNFAGGQAPAGCAWALRQYVHRIDVHEWHDLDDRRHADRQHGRKRLHRTGCLFQVHSD